MKIRENRVVYWSQTELFTHKIRLKLTNKQVSERQQMQKVCGLGLHSYTV